MKKGALAWGQIVAMLLAVVIIIVVVIIFSGKAGQSSKDITKCGGLLSFGEYKGQCSASCAPGTIESGTFTSDCPDGQVCCVTKGEE